MTIKKIWNYCDEEQRKILATANYLREEGYQKDMSVYDQGRLIALRQIQYYISQKCSKF